MIMIMMIRKKKKKKSNIRDIEGGVLSVTLI